MKKAILMMCLTFLAAGCSKGEVEPQQQATTAAMSEADPIKRGILAMDAIYASEGAFQEHGMPAIDSIVHELQAALALWPETGNGEGVDACRMALRLQTTYMLNVQGQLGASTDPRATDFRQACSSAVSYARDDARIHQVWDKLTATKQ